MIPPPRTLLPIRLLAPLLALLAGGCLGPIFTDATLPEPEERISLQATRQLGLLPTLAVSQAIWRDPGTGITLTHIPGGCFTMGDNQGKAHERPAHTVCLDDFWLSTHETTQAQWQRVMGSLPPQTVTDPRLPVENVSWNDLEPFLNRLNAQGPARYRLPTEAEWEFACRGRGKPGRYCGTWDDPTPFAWFDKKRLTLQPVGTLLPNELGLFDMNGNAWEWVADWYAEEYYQRSPGRNPTGPESGTAKVFRGGGVLSGPEHLQATVRSQLWPDRKNGLLGFRLAGEPPVTKR